MEHPRHQYPAETAALQHLAQSCGLAEQIKWGKPCFTIDGKNVALIQRFNDYLALLFFKGVLLADPANHLVKVGEMAAPRQLRFRSLAEITEHTPLIRSFLEQAIALERSGATVERQEPAHLRMPEELQARLSIDPALSKAFSGLTPGRQKAYIYHIASAKRPETRAARIEKHRPRILAGKGLTD